MQTINIGLRIRSLRKKKGLTQEVLASALSVSPQAVSKWESGLTYPDVAMIPAIAGFFQVSLDVLFDFDLLGLQQKIDDLLREAHSYFYEDPLRYAETVKTALLDYPGNEALLTALVSAYEYDLRENGNTAHLEELIRLAEKLISESGDFPRVCKLKELLAVAYLKKGDHAKSKEILESLPDAVTLRNDVMALHLNGKDKLNAAILSRCDHLQGLYIAAKHEGDAWLQMDAKERPANYIQWALKAYRKGLAVLEAYLLEEYEGQEQYLWNGMQTFHWGFYQCLAACYHRLGLKAECLEAVDTAYRIVSTAWKDFGENREYYMVPFEEYLAEYGLGEYSRQ